MTAYFTKYSENGASSRVRTYQNVAGRENIFPLFNIHYLEKKYANKKPYWDVVLGYLRRILALAKTREKKIYFEKEFFPYVPFYVENTILRIFGIRRHCKLIMDIDDGIFINYKKSAVKRILLGNKIEKMLEISDLVLCGSKTLHEYCCRFNENCVFLPSTYRNPSEISLKDLCFPLKVGWIGTPNTQKYLPDFFQSIPEEKRGLFDFFLIGASTSIRNELKYDGSVSIIPWSKETEALTLEQLHFGIMPLAPSDFEYYKCGYKIVQYFAHGKPAIASDHGANKKIISHGKDGLLFSAGDLTDVIEFLEQITPSAYELMCKEATNTYFGVYDYVDVRRKFQELTH